MVIAGLKLTHDAALAVMEDGVLVCSIELEKLGRRRYSSVRSQEDLDDMVAAADLDMSNLEAVVVDGWHARPGEELARWTFGDEEIMVGPYGPTSDPMLRRVVAPGPFRRVPAFTCGHVTSHVFAAALTDPRPPDEPTFVLVWDGGTSPILFVLDPARRTWRIVGRPFGMFLNVYSVLAMHRPPFQRRTGPVRDRLDVAGKVMAFIATGQPRADLLAGLTAAWQSAERRGPSHRRAWEFSRAVLSDPVAAAAEPADLLASLHQVVADALVDGTLRLMREEIARAGIGRPARLAIAGGAGLNIKWNSLFRAHPDIASVWVPPFPNDSGCALGAAAAYLFETEGLCRIGWSVFSGPELLEDGAATAREPVSPEAVAALLATGEPVVLLQGAAELGPRALGHRSILADPRSASMRERLNEIKGREWYRPIAPICIADRSAEVFDPGGDDRFMVFEHQVRPSWASAIPAVVHLDGSARLQTVGPTDDAFVHAVLTSFDQLTGVPVLCNTSANLNGRGFFTSVAEALRWGRVRWVVADGWLYRAP